MVILCEPFTSPAGRVITRAEALNARLGHENLGSLSAARGFVPVQAPRLSLPSSHRAWDDVAAQLPHLYRDVAVRPVLQRMPVLAADARSLPDAALHRAATVLGILGHAYVHVSRPTGSSCHRASQRPGARSAVGWAGLASRCWPTRTSS